MKTIQISNGSIIVCDENGNAEKSLTIPFNENISRSEIYELLLASSSTITPVGLNIINGVYLTSSNKISLQDTDGTFKISGDSILANGLDVKDLIIANDSKVYDRGEIESVTVDGGETVVSCEDKAYKYSVLTGTEVSGGVVDYSARIYRVSIAHHTNLMATLSTFTSENTLSDVAEDLEDACNEAAGSDVVEIEYDTDNEVFVVKSLIPGSVDINFDGSNEYNVLMLGMANPTLEYGTEDYSSMKIKFINGDADGEEYTIASMDAEDIHIAEEITENVPDAGDQYIIYDPSESAEINIMLWEYSK